MQYINNVPLASGEITIVTSDHAKATMIHASRLAFDAKKLGLDTLIINCGMSDKRFRDHIAETYGEEGYLGPTRILMHTSPLGDLIGDQDCLNNLIDQAKIKSVILCGWEFASTTRRRKERLISYLRALMTDYNISVTIYCHTAIAPVAGKVDRGGIGKLGLLAYAVCEIDSSEMLETTVKHPEMIITTKEEDDEATRSVNLLLNKINEIAGDGQKILHSYEAPGRGRTSMLKERRPYTSFDDEEDGGVLVPA
ncbi:MAG TPA: hypothetical protein VFO76_05715 [Candidatus Kapabacteria bacterium]|nr:hypothetical protein [Candidatus Kapabacteria bacterium]